MKNQPTVIVTNLNHLEEDSLFLALQFLRVYNFFIYFSFTFYFLSL